jgi:hypothetical protein
MTLMMAMVTIEGLTYSSASVAAKQEWEYHLHLGYVGQRPAM